MISFIVRNLNPRKLFRLIHAVSLMILNVRFFNPDRIFRDKSIAIIGPADSVYSSEFGKEINSYDYVIRFNKALNSWDSSLESFVGNKCDILINQFNEEADSGGGRLDFELFKKYNVKYVLNAKHHFYSFKNVFFYYWRTLRGDRIYIIARKHYLKCEALFLSNNATNGFRGLFMALNSNPSKVLITGFTFYKSPYINNYRSNNFVPKKNDEIKSVMGDCNDFSKFKYAYHDPDFEFDLFWYLIKNADFPVKVDTKLKGILNEHIENLKK